MGWLAQIPSGAPAQRYERSGRQCQSHGDQHLGAAGEVIPRRMKRCELVGRTPATLDQTIDALTALAVVEGALASSSLRVESWR